MSTPDLIQRTREEFDTNRHLLQPALDRDPSKNTLEDVLDWVLDGKMQLWSGPGYAAVTEVLNYPHSRTVQVYLAGGEMDAVMGFEANVLTPFARGVEATGITVNGRRGWVRQLEKRGYREATTTIYKEL